MFTNMRLIIGPAAILNTCTEYHVNIDCTKVAVQGKSLLELTPVEEAPVGFVKSRVKPSHAHRSSLAPGPDFR